MDADNFRKIFSDLAKSHDFSAAHGGWYIHLQNILLILELQKSSFSSHFELNIKLFLVDDPPQQSGASKSQVKRESGDIFLRPPSKCRQAFDLESPMEIDKRKAVLENMFSEVINLIIKECITPAGILRLRDNGVLFLLPNVEAKLRAS